MTETEARETLEKYHQEHILSYLDAMSEQDKLALWNQIADTDFSVLKQIMEKKSDAGRGVISPIKAMQLPEIKENKEIFTAKGLETIRAGKVGAVLLAGGMGTRLGSDAPKGMYDIGISKHVYIFERIIRNLLDVVDTSSTWVHLFIMTSDKNHKATVDFFEKMDYFSYNKDYIHFFQQEMAPAATYEGKVYMEAKNKIATSPNGNGGWFSSMKKAGILDIIHKAGIEWLNVFAIFPLPVIGIPIHTKSLGGVDSLYSIVQMPSGIPVATVAIDGAANAAILAAKMLSISDMDLRKKLADYKEGLKNQVVAKAEKLDAFGYEAYLKQM